MSKYPHHPGYREGDTSKGAADAIADSAEALRDIVMAALRQEPRTVHEVSEDLSIGVPSIQPRFSELRALQLIRPSGAKHLNPTSGRPAHVWELGSEAARDGLATEIEEALAR